MLIVYIIKINEVAATKRELKAPTTKPHRVASTAKWGFDAPLTRPRLLAGVRLALSLGAPATTPRLGAGGASKCLKPQLCYKRT